ncbi:MAG TPA: M81 family metallopeptidase, partial [Thermomicrobiales bacterium]|nr:M81 family metallopeptidase [Thermomicrobiales bacterium]
MTFRVAAAQISHETNRFSAVPTDFAAFQASGLKSGDAIVVATRGANTEFAGFLDGAAACGFELIPTVAVWATPSGMVTREAIERLATMLLDDLRRALAVAPLDGVLLALHGAMVTEVDDDGDAYLLRQVRGLVGSSVPIVSTLDLHANIS